jgi:hypothetical protein
VHDSRDNNGVALNQEVHCVRKSLQQRSTRARTQMLTLERTIYDPIKRGAKIDEKLERKPRTLVLVPGQCSVHVEISLGPNDDSISAH